MPRPEMPYPTVREVDALDGQRQGHCDGCGMTFPIAGDRAFDGTRYWQPLNITVLLADRDAARAELAQHAALVARAREYAEACAAYKCATLAVREAEGTDRMFDADLAIAWDEAGKAYTAAHDALCNTALAVQPAASVARGEGEGEDA